MKEKKIDHFLIKFKCKMDNGSVSMKKKKKHKRNTDYIALLFYINFEKIIKKV